jgi:gluconolactonase
MTDKIRLNGQWLTWLLVAGAPAVWAQAPANQTVVRDIPGIVKAGTPIVVIKNGLAGADDPIGLPDGSVLFTEPNASRVLKLGKDGTLSTFLENTYGGLGLSLDSTGRLIQARSKTATPGCGNRPARAESILAQTYNGLPFNRPNDLIADKKGGVYVTDPGLNGDQRAALERTNGANALASRLPPAVYYIPPGGNPIRIAEGIERPNGVTLSRDERILYINNTNGIYLSLSTFNRMERRNAGISPSTKAG